MWIPRSTSWILVPVLLLASLAGVAGHDHGASVERGAYECQIDHESAHGTEAPSSTPEMGASGPRHMHQCVGCHSASYRSLLAALDTAAFGLRPTSEDEREPDSAPRLTRLWTPQTLRGPPAV